MEANITDVTVLVVIYIIKWVEPSHGKAYVMDGDWGYDDNHTDFYSLLKRFRENCKKEFEADNTNKECTTINLSFTPPFNVEFRKSEKELSINKVISEEEQNLLVEEVRKLVNSD